MTTKLPKLIATSVVRGSQQGESHGGIYTIDFESQTGEQHVDWNTSSIDFEGRGADRGLRGITFDGDDIYVAASDELFCYDRNFEVKHSYRNRYLKHCHEIVRMGRRIFVTSTGFDSLLSFNLDTKSFDWGFRLLKQYEQWDGFTFDPQTGTGPRPENDFHINSVHVDDSGVYLSGFALFNDTASDHVRYVPRDGGQQAYEIVTYDESDIELAGIDDSKVARQGFGRGLCVVDDRFIAAGSSPSTITLYDTHSKQRVGSVNLSMDIRNAIHGLEVWPYDSC